MKLLLRRVVGLVAQVIYPGFNACGRCGRPWIITKPHDTFYAPGLACFPLCEDCWGELRISERIPYYVELIGRWGMYQEVHQQKADAILTAVKRGK